MNCQAVNAESQHQLKQQDEESSNAASPINVSRRSSAFTSARRDLGLTSFPSWRSRQSTFLRK